MAIEIISDTIFKPSPSSPPNPLLNTQIPLTIFDRIGLPIHIPILYAFKPPMPTTKAMLEGLSEVLNLFPHLAGRIIIDDRSRPCILLNNAGIRLAETRFDATLVEHLPLDPSNDLARYYLPIQGAKELLQIQINRFACGGMVIGVSSHHKVADGQSMGFFLSQWTRLVRGLEVDPLPYHDRAAVCTPRNPPRCDFDHREIEYEWNFTSPSSLLACFVVHFSPNFLTQLKEHVIGTNSVNSYSTFTCLVAHIWKKISFARGLDGDVQTQVTLAVNGRARMRPPVPMEYFGNLVLSAQFTLSVKDLLKESYGFAAKVISNEMAKVDDAYFRSFIDFGVLAEGEELDGLGTAKQSSYLLSPDLEVDCWLRINLDDLDFGSGKPCAFVPGPLPIEGSVVCVPSCDEKGGVDAHITLLEDQVDLFKQISHLLD